MNSKRTDSLAIIAENERNEGVKFWSNKEDAIIMRRDI
jgi:hypothetical protein